MKTIFVQYCSRKQSYTPKVCIEVEMSEGQTTESLNLEASFLLEHYWRNSDEKWRIGVYDPTNSIEGDFTIKMIIKYKE